MQFKDEQLLHIIVEKLTVLAMQTKAMGKLNMLDSNVSSEYFYCQYFNTLFDLKLRSSNEKNSHEEAIDLYDDDNRVVVQVSSRSDAAKIEGALASDKSKERPGYRFIYICIIDTDGKKPKKINNKGSFSFDLSKDFFDINGIIKETQNCMCTPKMGVLYKLVSDQLCSSVDMEKLDSDLTKVVMALADKSRSRKPKPNPDFKQYDIYKKIDFNKLDVVEDDIMDGYRYSGKLRKIYNEYSKELVSFSEAVLSEIHELYVTMSQFPTDPVLLFYKIKDEVCNIVKRSKNFSDEISETNLKFCAKIIVADSFIRCKIFKKPEDLK